MQAIWDNRIDVMNAYINYHRNRDIRELNVEDKNGFAPIHYAAKLNRFAIMKKLIEAEDVEVFESENEEELEVEIHNHLPHGSGKTILQELQ